MTEYVTSDGATVYLLARDVRDYLQHGDMLCAAEGLQKCGAWAQWRRWIVAHLTKDLEELARDHWRFEHLVADLLEWGRGEVRRPECAARYPATLLHHSESRGDGFDKREYWCPEGHTVLVTGKQRYGAIDDLGPPLPLPDPPFGRYLYPIQCKPPMDSAERAKFDARIAEVMTRARDIRSQ